MKEKSRTVQRVSGSLQIAFCAILCTGLLLLGGCEGDGGGGSNDFGDNDPNVIYALGDSITAEGYPAILASMIGRTVVNGGVSGQKTAEGVGRVSSALNRHSPGYLLILMGANDVIHSRSVDSIISNLRTMIQTAKGNMTVPIIGTLTPMTGDHELWAGQVEVVNDEIRQLAREQGIRCADLYSAFGSDAAYLKADGLHPTQEGSQVIDATFMDAID